MEKRIFKDKIYTELASLTRSLGNPHRLEIIELLAQGEFSVEQIAEQTSLSVANASQHLQVLKAARLVDTHRAGHSIYYRLASANVFKAWKALRALGIESNATIGKVVTEFRKAKFNYQPVTIDELVRKVKSGKVTILDVRPEHEYNKGHIANAVSIPIDQLAKRLKELPKRTEVVAYCRGPFCVFADEAVALLSKSGYKATRLEEGFPDWSVKGLPVEEALLNQM